MASANNCNTLNRGEHVCNNRQKSQALNQTFAIWWSYRLLFTIKYTLSREPLTMILWTKGCYLSPIPDMMSAELKYILHAMGVWSQCGVLTEFFMP